MNLDVPVADARRVEVVANSLPLWHGSQLAIDATIVSPLTRLGDAHPPRRCRSRLRPCCCSAPQAASDIPRVGAVIGAEVGGRFGAETVQLLRLLARHKAATVPAASRPAGITAWVARWSGLLAVAAQRAYAAFLLELLPAEGPVPAQEVFADARWD